MAVQQGYGKMAGANSLVFAYDTGDTVNSYKGEPTVNITPNYYLAWSTLSGTRTANAIKTSDGVLEGMKLTGTDNTQVRTEFTQPNPSQEGYYTFSVEGKRGSSPYIGLYTYMAPYSSPYVLYNIDTNTITAATSNIHDYGVEYVKDGWYRIWITVLIRTDQTNRIWKVIQTNSISPSGGVVDGYVYYAKAQLEANKHVTPFTTGTRSATEGLLDLTGNHTVDVSTLDFTNGFELDGTNDHMTFNLTKTPNMTFEFITNFSGDVTTGQMVFNAGNTSAGPDLYMACGKLNWNIWDGCNNPFANIPGSWDNGKNHHVVLVNDQTNNITKLYYDGALLGTATYRECTADRMSIGGDGSSYNYQGNLPLFKVYSEALTEAQVQSNFKNYRKRFEGLDYHIDDTTDGGGWIRWWWYTGVGWPGHETEALGHPFGTFDSSSHYGFQRLPEGLEKEQVELLAKDGDGNIYKWDFARSSATAQRVWDSFTTGAQGKWHNSGDAWNPEVIAGSFFNTDQDAWQYRESEGVVSFMLDDDTCDCKSTLNAGHAMCGATWNPIYAQPDGAYLRYGVDTLNDGGCRGPVPERTLELYYRLK
jgi:hypothetical protein